MPARPRNHNDPITRRVHELRIYLDGRGHGAIKRFAIRLGIYTQKIQAIDNGHCGLSAKVALQIVERTGVSSRWLLTGIGPMWIKEASDAEGQAHD